MSVRHTNKHCDDTNAIHTPNMTHTLLFEHTVESVDEFSLAQCSTTGKTESPPSSLFMCAGKPPQPNYQTPQLLCVLEDARSSSSTSHELHLGKVESADGWKTEITLYIIIYAQTEQCAQYKEPFFQMAVCSPSTSARFCLYLFL